MRKRNFFLFLICFLFFVTIINPINAFAAEPKDIREYKEPPYFYTYFNGGNCVWFAWEMAYQEWGLKLPKSGDARKWTQLENRTIYKDDFKYKIKLADSPMRNSIAIFQPKDLRKIAGGPFENDHCGHVAWIYDINHWNPNKIYVMESSIYPPSGGKRWHGCWWQENIYDIKDLPSMKYLYIGELSFVNKEHNLNFTIQGMNTIAKKVDNNTYKLSTKENDKILLKLNQEKLIYVDSVNKVTFQKSLKNNFIEIDVNSEEICLEIKDSYIKITPILPEGEESFVNALDIEEDNTLKGLLMLIKD